MEVLQIRLLLAGLCWEHTEDTNQFLTRLIGSNSMMHVRVLTLA
jgi:hypothetical protein